MNDLDPVVVVFACDYCAYTAADVAGRMKLSYPAGVRILRVPCTGKVEGLHLMHALQLGADGVLVAGCLAGDCHFKSGNLRAAARVKRVQTLLEDIGIGGGRVAMTYMSAGQGAVFANTVSEFSQQIAAMGPNPIKRGAREAA
jgi:F420-non-reducing hydrogenase iron-sulfur subunit